MPPFDRIDDWGAFWRNDVIGWEGYWIFIFLTEVYCGLAAIIWFIRWFRANEILYWKEWLYFAVIVIATLRFAPWNQDLDYRKFTGDGLHNRLLSGLYAKMQVKSGFTWSESRPHWGEDARIKWASVRESWRQADTKFEAVLWKIAWGFIYMWTMAIPTVVILAKFGGK